MFRATLHPGSVTGGLPLPERSARRPQPALNIALSTRRSVALCCWDCMRASIGPGESTFWALELGSAALSSLSWPQFIDLRTRCRDTSTLSDGLTQHVRQLELIEWFLSAGGR